MMEPDTFTEKIREPDVSYGTNPIQRCYTDIIEDEMPCCYTDEEFAEVLRRSEASGNAPDSLVKAMYAKWGH